MIWINQA